MLMVPRRTPVDMFFICRCLYQSWCLFEGFALPTEGALKERRRCRYLTAGIIHAEPSVCTLPNIESRCLVISIAYTTLFICTVTRIVRKIYLNRSQHTKTASVFSSQGN